MSLLLFAAVAVGFFIDAWAMRTALVTAIHQRLLRNAYFLTLGISVVVSVYTTFVTEYMVDENTRIVGWPVLLMVWHRRTIEGPWLDYIGPTVLLAYPINVSIFMFVPSVLLLVSSKRELTSKGLRFKTTRQ